MTSKIINLYVWRLQMFTRRLSKIVFGIVNLFIVHRHLLNDVAHQPQWLDTEREPKWRAVFPLALILVNGTFVEESSITLTGIVKMHAKIDNATTMHCDIVKSNNRQKLINIKKHHFWQAYGENTEFICTTILSSLFFPSGTYIDKYWYGIQKAQTTVHHGV